MSKLMHRKEREAQLRRQHVWRCVKAITRWLSELLALLFCVVVPFILLAYWQELGIGLTFAFGVVWIICVFGLLFVLSLEDEP